MNFNKFLRISIIFLVITAWIFSGFPRIWQNLAIPPEIKEAQATVPAGIIIAWPDTNALIPGGWQRVTGLDYYLKGTTSNPSGTVGGATEHNHAIASHTHSVPSHTHTVPAFTVQAETVVTKSGTGGASTVEHTHASFTSGDSTATSNIAPSGYNWNNASNDPPRIEVIWIQPIGSAAGIPNQALVFLNSNDLPSGWGRVYGNRFLKGVSGDGGTEYDTGSHEHTHTDPGHLHTENTHTHTGTSATGVGGRSSVAGSTIPATTHTHPVSSSPVAATESTNSASATLTGDGQPPFHKLNIIKNNTGSASLPNGIIAAWTGLVDDIPANWVLCNGSNGTPNLNDKFIKGATADAELGSTGGGTSHSHGAGAATHTHSILNHIHTWTSSAPSNTVAVSGVGSTSAPSGHTHSIPAQTTSGAGTTGTATAGADTSTGETRPLFKEAVFIMYRPPDLTWDTSPANFKIYQSSSLTWNVGTEVCSGTLNDDNNQTISCTTGSIASSTQYRVQVILKNVGSGAANMSGASEYVDHKNVKAGWAGTSPALGSCGFEDFGSDNTSASCNSAWSGNNVRMTNTGTNVKLAATTGTEGFMYLITTGDDVPSTNSTSFMDASIDSVTEDSSKITITGPAVSITCTPSASLTAFGPIDNTQVFTSSPNIVITAGSNGSMQITVYDTGGGAGKPGLYCTACSGDADEKTIGSANAAYDNDATLAANAEGYGIRASSSGSKLAIGVRYAQTGNTVGGLEVGSGNAQVLASSTEAVTPNENVTIVHKAAVAAANPLGSYLDTITYSCSPN